MSPAKLVTVVLDGQHIGIDVTRVLDVIRIGAISPVPLSPDWVAGVMNLRGRIVTAIDLRARLGLPPRSAGDGMCIVVDHGGEPYGFIVDDVGDVIDVDPETIEAEPSTLGDHWRAVSDGVVKRDTLVLVVNVRAIMEAGLATAA